jgi:hypothetical protein
MTSRRRLRDFNAAGIEDRLYAEVAPRVSDSSMMDCVRDYGHFVEL